MDSFLLSEEKERLNKAITFSDLAEVAIDSLKRMSAQHSEIVQICGPMSTGGCGSFKKNMERFESCVIVAVRHGVAVFNQIDYQEACIRICDWKDGEPYPMGLLEDFYGKVLSSGYIKKGLFLPDWKSSFGARWEWDFLISKGLVVEDYPKEWLSEINVG